MRTVLRARHYSARTEEAYVHWIRRFILFHESFGRPENGCRVRLSFLCDVLRGGFGTPDEGFVLEWRHHARSQTELGHSAAALGYERLLKTCHPSNVASITAELALARQGRGQTLFDLIVEIIRDHGPGGSEAEDGVDLVRS